jgi:predicted enzyme related to lactoylglutathione lyase
LTVHRSESTQRVSRNNPRNLRAFPCDDANALHDLIVKRGGAILSPLADGPFGRFFVAGDPDGYAITFHTARS